jgi:predicted YcjX-like family ATPase
MKLCYLDNHQIDHLKHCVRVAGERFAENLKMLNEIQSANASDHRAARDLASTFERYVEQCDELASLLVDADCVTLVGEEEEVRS